MSEEIKVIRENRSIHVSSKKHGKFWDMLMKEKGATQGIGDYILCELKKYRSRKEKSE